MRQRRLQRLFKRLHELQCQAPSRNPLSLKLGAAKQAAGRADGLLTVQVPAEGEAVSANTFSFALNRQTLRQVRRHEGRYLLRSNLGRDDPVQLWTWSIQLTEVEQAFKEVMGDLSIRLIDHQHDERIDAHLFFAFLAYCLRVTLKARLPRWPPDGPPARCGSSSPPSRWSICILNQQRLRLPPQPPPTITSTLQTAVA